jgi:hypothetical protein
MKPTTMKLKIPSLPWLPSVGFPFRMFCVFRGSPSLGLPIRGQKFPKNLSARWKIPPPDRQ